MDLSIALRARRHRFVGGAGRPAVLAPAPPAQYFGAAAVGSVYDMLNEDKRNAVEIIIEERAEERDPEDKDGNLPELERPRR